LEAYSTILNSQCQPTVVIILRDTASEMQHVADAMMEWSEANHMNVNVKKTKEMVLNWTNRQGIGDASHDDSQSASTGLRIQTFRRDN